MKYFKLIIRIAIAVILIQTLRFKFTAHPDSVYIFTQVGLEPFGRIGIGVLELIASILILVPKTTWLGATLVIGIIGGAIMMHLTQLGIEINGDGGLLFYTAIITFALSLLTLWFSRTEIPFIGQKFFSVHKA
ncbi:DoxX family protein [Winogradskyella sp. PC-19]|uniref:DoxX family membrane protein n=1 Tax=unclassified Winogradskyella TaxID=2615021 RepID=UPI000B3D0A3C|nr:MULTISPECIES: DoxX family membrane protein [unclassified Winogradskyella]ARV08423.1 DoxX family protein [Winogradskyella sp. PC-19]RZN75028.1 MAG: DoxX family membrane protein [Winogradskyella sp.]